MGRVVRSFKKAWFVQPKRKPPDLNKIKEREQRQFLRRALLLMATTPSIIRGQNNHGFVSYEELPNLSHEEAHLLRDVIANTSNKEFLDSFNGLQGVVDSGASNFSTFDINDFEKDTYQKSEGNIVMKGIAGGLKIEGRGTV